MSNETFAVGEIAIFWQPEDPHGHHNTECEIVGGLRKRTARVYRTDITFTEAGYRIKMASDGSVWSCQPEYLRKKKPPSELNQLVSWDDVPLFNPTKKVES